MEAEEAALSLLSMGHTYQATSSATLNSILTTTLPIIPQKRKHSESDSPSAPFYTPSTYQPPLPTPLSPPPKLKESKKGTEATTIDTSTEAVDCICGFAVDDGFSIACDICSKWCHSACFGIAQGAVPEKFQCWACKPRPLAEKERAVKLQKDKLGLIDAASTGGGRRRSSPGLERRGRRGTTAGATAPTAIETSTSGTGKKKRRPSIMQPPPTPPNNISTPTTTTNGNGEDEHIDIDNEPWKEAYVHIAEDIIPNDDTRSKLRQQAANWRGVTALGSSPAVVPSTTLTSTPPISIKPIPLQTTLNPFLSHNLNPHVLPPSFALHTTQPIPSQSLITPFRSCVTPSSAYLSDPLNAYAHLGMPKPYVHLLGPPLDVALDARLVGNQGRFVRWGCRPNAALRPVMCDKPVEDDTSLGFGVFALRDLRANEEIVLGWEWDDGNAIHHLPALLQAPFTYPIPSSSSPLQVQHFKNQYSNILHALSSTFTTCACGARARDCALTQMAAFVDGKDIGGGSSLSRRQPETPVDPNDTDDEILVDMGPLVGRKRGFRTKERLPGSGGIGGMEMAPDERSTPSPGPSSSSSKQKGRGVVFIGRDKELPPPPPSFVGAPPSPTPTPTSRSSWKGKERAIEGVTDVEMLDGTSGVISLVPPNNSRSTFSSTTTTSLLSPSPIISSSPHRERIRHTSEPRPPDPPDGAGADDTTHEAEARMPPKMRKHWMHRTVEARRVVVETEVSMLKDSGQAIEARPSRGLISDSPEHRLMPPPPIPESSDPKTISSTSVSVTMGSPNLGQQNLAILQTEEPRKESTSPPLSGQPAAVEADANPPRPPSPPFSPSSPKPTSPSPPGPSLSTAPHTTSSPPPPPPPRYAAALTSITSTSSPLTGFASLSLLSPALGAELRPRQPSPLVPPIPAPRSSLANLHRVYPSNEHSEDLEHVENGASSRPPQTSSPLSTLPQLEAVSPASSIPAEAMVHENPVDVLSTMDRDPAETAEWDNGVEEEAIVRQHLEAEKEQDPSMDLVDSKQETTPGDAVKVDQDLGDVEMTDTHPEHGLMDGSRASTAPPVIEERGPSTSLSASVPGSRAASISLSQSPGPVTEQLARESPASGSVSLPHAPEIHENPRPRGSPTTVSHFPVPLDENDDEQLDYGPPSPEVEHSPMPGRITSRADSRSHSRSSSPPANPSAFSTRSSSSSIERVQAKVEETEVSVNGLDSLDEDAMDTDEPKEKNAESLPDPSLDDELEDIMWQLPQRPDRDRPTRRSRHASSLLPVRLRQFSPASDSDHPSRRPRHPSSYLPARPRSPSPTSTPSPSASPSIPLPPTSLNLAADSSVQSTPEPPPQKVKMSLKDFALRKKKQRELEEKEKVDDRKEKSVERKETEKKPLKQILEELRVGSTNTAASTPIANGFRGVPGDAGAAEKENHVRGESKEGGEKVELAENAKALPEGIAKGINGVGKAHHASAIIDLTGPPTDMPNEPPKQSAEKPKPPPIVQTNVDRDFDRSSPSRSSPLPSKPLMPFRRPPSRSNMNSINGHSPASTLAQPIKQQLPTRPERQNVNHTSAVVPKPFNNRLERIDTKEETLECPLPLTPIHTTPLSSTSNSYPSLLQRVSGIERSASPTNPDPAPLASRISSHATPQPEEDGEIDEASPPPPPARTIHHLPSRRDFPFNGQAGSAPRPLSRNGHPYTPLAIPSGPRALYNPPVSPSTTRANSSLPSSNVTSTAVNVNRPPTGPRALRQAMLNKSTPGPSPSQPSASSPTIPSTSSSTLPHTLSTPTSGGQQYIPRGPSADRDRDRDRDGLRERIDWDQRQYRGPNLPAQPPRRSGGGYGHGWGR